MASKVSQPSSARTDLRRFVELAGGLALLGTALAGWAAPVAARPDIPRPVPSTLEPAAAQPSAETSTFGNREFPPAPYTVVTTGEATAIVDAPNGPWFYGLATGIPGTRAGSHWITRYDADTGAADLLVEADGPGSLDISSDGSRLCLAARADDRCIVRQFLLGTGWTWTFTYDRAGFTCNDVLPVPGSADRLIVPTITEGVIVLRDGSVEPRRADGGWLISSLVSGSGSPDATSVDDGMRVYGFAAWVKNGWFLRVVDDGIVADGGFTLTHHFTVDQARVDGEQVYVGPAIYDAASMTLIGEFPRPAGVSSWGGTGLISRFDRSMYSVVAPAANGDEDIADGRINIFDLLTRRYIDTLSLIDLGLRGYPTKMIEIRPGEFAFILVPGFVNTGKVVIVDAGSRRGSAGEFTPLTPQRVLDTRSGIGRPASERRPVGEGEAITVQITGRAGIPAGDVSAVVLNVTAVGPSDDTYLTVYPSGTALPEVSNLNLARGAIRPNLVTVPIGADGAVAVFNARGTTDVVFDVAGFYATATGRPGSRFVPLSPTRVLDTRSGIGGTHDPVRAGAALDVHLAGRGGLPASGATAVALNVTAVDSTAPSYLSVHPSDADRPEVSNLNFLAGPAVPNQVIVRLPDDGRVTITNERGAVDVIVDVVGYYVIDDSHERGRFFPSGPYRFLDTRRAGIFPGDGKVWDGAGVEISDPDEPFAALVMNVTAVDSSTAGFVTVYPNSEGGAERLESQLRGRLDDRQPCDRPHRPRGRLVQRRRSGPPSRRLLRRLHLTTLRPTAPLRRAGGRWRRPGRRRRRHRA